MISLQREPSNVFVWENREYAFHPYFNRVLTVILEVLPDTLLDDAEKVSLTIRAFSEDAPIEAGVFEGMIHELFPRQDRKNEKKLIDFEQDAGLIYAAFLQTYAIDLYKQRNQMDWRIFQALLQAIPENTELSRVISLRAQKLPKKTKHNADYVDSLANAKRAVALKEPEADKKKRLAEAWKRVAESWVR